MMRPLAERRWYACHTRSRHEQKSFDWLRRRGFESYLPVVPRVSQWKDRKKVVHWPAFPGYVFVRFSDGDVHTILTTPGVSTIVRSNGRPTPIPDEEMENVRAMMKGVEETGVVPVLRPLLDRGDRVVVVSGPFQGVVGRVIESRGRCRLLVGLTSVGQGLELEVGVHAVKKIS